MTPRWHRYLSLPHKFGANPDDGIGCDCLIMTFNVLRDADQPRPPFDEEWLQLASQGRWAELRQQWLQLTDLTDMSDYATVLFENPAGLGLGIVVSGGLLFPHHSRGVHWLPGRKTSNREFRRFR